MDYKNYFLKCRERYEKPTPSLKSFYEDPLRIIPKNIFSIKTKEYLENMSISLKKEFDNGINDIGTMHVIKNILRYKKSIESVSNELIPYLEETMYGCNLYIDKIYIYRTKPLKKKKESYLWHHDNNPNEIVKLIIYLNDVDIFNSPFEYLANESNKGILAQCTRLGPDYWEAPPNDGRLEKEVEDMIKFNNYHNKKITGDKFTAFAFSNNIIHRANPIIKGYRDVLNIRVKPTINKPPQYFNSNWTSSFESSGAVNPNPMIDWQNEINSNIFKKNLSKIKKVLSNKIKSISKKIPSNL
tara:strand:- start:408 stop:1304 length:897 start_codon:yes stop_codon:yes gene_type:complete